MAKWRRLGIELAGWLISPTTLVGAVLAVAGLVWAAVAGLPAVVVALIALAALTFGVVLAVESPRLWRRVRSQTQTRTEDVGHRCRMVEEELREIAREHPVVTNADLVFNKGAEDTPQKWMSAAREYIETVQGPATEARFTHADDPRSTAIEIANALDLSRLPSVHEIQAANDARRRASGLYPPGASQMVIPGRRVQAPDKGGLSPAERQEAMDNLFYPPRDDRRELGEACDSFAMKVRIFIEARAETKEIDIAKAAAEIVDADQGISPEDARKQAERHVERLVETVYATELRGEAMKLFNEAREHHAIADKKRRIAEHPNAFAMDEVPEMYGAIARRLSYEPAERTRPPQPGAALAKQMDELLRKGIEIYAELSAPVEPKVEKGTLTIEGREAPQEWWDQAQGYQNEIRELLTTRNPALLTVFAEGFNAALPHNQPDQPDGESKPVRGRETVEKMLEFATAFRSGPATVVNACLDGLAAARLDLAKQNLSI